MKINFISLDIPYPPNYGGAIDIFYKIKAFSKLGCKTYLHCFYSDRVMAIELEEYCERVYYYPRINNINTQLFSKNPFLVESRTSKKLIYNLNKNEYPIFFDGLQSTSISMHDDFINRGKYLRIHNIESEYLKRLAISENRILKKGGLFLESIKYKIFEKKLEQFNYIFSISDNDRNFYNAFNKKIKTVLPFHGNNEIKSLNGKGKFVLFHGNFNVSENTNSAKFLINNIFNTLDIPLIIAGINASQKLSLNKNKNIKIINNPDQSEMGLLIQTAQINILPTSQATGVKLKLINSLFNGRHCIVNSKMISPTPELEELCIICNSDNEFKNQINTYMEIPFDSKMIEKRKLLLNTRLDDLKNAQIILDIIKNE